jgi:hypothetical protein
MTETPAAGLEGALDDFDPRVRAAALRDLSSLVDAGAVPLGPGTERVNMHCHSFFSFNAGGRSPASLAWLGRRLGLSAMGLVDFDSLDGVDEFLEACDLLELRGTAGIETRVFVPEYAAEEINSPGEPGICYHMGIGLTRSIPPVGAAPILTDLAGLAAGRNQEMVARLNAALHPIVLDYARDVLPLTPSGRPTERHLVLAYLRAAQGAVPDAAAFWAERLGAGADEVAALLPERPALQTLIRSRLMKRGGPGYVEPAPAHFPSLPAFHELIVACGGLPCAAWLDGTSPVEQRIEEWLEFLVGRGVVALNIIPDRNWNFSDPELRRARVAALYRVVELARDLALPLNIGTEMNGYGQPLVDDLSVPELRPVQQAFLDGAFFVYGHTALQRAAGMGWQSAWAAAALPGRPARSAFYTLAGRLLPPGRQCRERLGGLSPDLSPHEVLAVLGRPPAERSEP